MKEYSDTCQAGDEVVVYVFATHLEKFNLKLDKIL
jgi:hypothetical protein